MTPSVVERTSIWREPEKGKAIALVECLGLWNFGVVS